jgi:uncharacterized protein YbjT (DUF2867 family)
MIVVTTPTGGIGSQVLNHLVEAGEAVRVIARDPERLPAALRDRVEVVAGSHGDAAVVDRAFAGADALFWLPPPNPKMAHVDDVYAGFARPACAAVTAHGVRHVVTISALGRGTRWEKTSGFIAATLQVDDMFAATGANMRALTMPGFMDNLLWQATPIREKGMFFLSWSPDHKMPSCATRDIAAAAAQLLRNRDWTGVGHRAVLGPEDISPNDMARIMSEVLGKPVRFQQIPFAADRAHMKQLGASDAFADAYIAMMIAKEEGMDNAEPRTAEATTPTSFRMWCEEVLKPAVAAAPAPKGH